MRLYDLHGPRAHVITQFGSAGVVISPIARPGGFTQIARMDFTPGGQIGEHPADIPQLFVVLTGEGWVSGRAGQRVAIRAGQAAFWEPGENHASGTLAGMTTLVIEAETLDPAALLAEIPFDFQGSGGK